MSVLSHRPVGADDLAEVVRFPRDADELFFAYPRATWPFSVEQLADAIAQRQGSTVALLDGRIAGFANFYQWEPGAYCASATCSWPTGPVARAWRSTSSA